VHLRAGLSAQGFGYRLVQFCGGAGDGGVGGIGRISRPIGNGAAGTADHGDESGNVPRVYDGIDRDVDEAGGEHQVTVAVGPRAVEAAGVDQRIGIRVRLIVSEVAVVAGNQSGLGEVSGGAAADRLAVERRRVVVADSELTERRLVDGAEHRLALMEEADEGGPKRDAGDEAFGAVDRIEHPDPLRASVFTAEFLPNNAVIREARFDHLPHNFFSAAIGGGDGRVVDLELNGGAGIAEIRSDEVGAGAGEFGEEGAFRGEFHGEELAHVSSAATSLTTH